VVDNVKCPLQLYYWNKLAVLYSYDDNKSCVNAKHIVIMNMLWKEEDIQDQVVSLEQDCIYGRYLKADHPMRLENTQSTWFLW
jgi:hypothetical protein